jgi:UDP-glucose 4-epimerase
MVIAITGALGYVGGRLTEYFSANKENLIIALSRKAGQVNIALPENVKLMTPEQYQAHESLTKTDVFIHLAALNEHDCVKYPKEAIEVNIGQTVQWLDLAQQAGIKKFIYFSTAHVYRKPLEGNFDEMSPTHPVHPYAITHKCAEDYVLAYRSEKKMNNTVIRLTNAFGGPAYPTADRWTLLVNDLCKSAVEKGEMVLLSDGLQPRDFICLEEVCNATSHLLKLPETQLADIYNLGSGNSTTVWDMAQRVHTLAEKVLNKKIVLKRKEPMTGTQSSSLHISIDRLLKTKYKPVNDIDKEVVLTLHYFQQSG